MSKLFILILLILISCAGCNPNGTRRPNSALCTPILGGGNSASEFECTDTRGDFREPVGNILGTTLDGYAILEKYVDDLEIENRKLRRGCQ